jgi:hypothetical protein
MVRPIGSLTKPPEPMPDRCADCGWVDWFENPKKNGYYPQCAVFTDANLAWVEGEVCQAKRNDAEVAKVNKEMSDYQGLREIARPKKSHKKKVVAQIKGGVEGERF